MRFYFYLSEPEKIKQEFLKLFPLRINDIIIEAEALCRHNFKIFNLNWATGKDIDWHKDIVIGKMASKVLG